MLSTFLKSTPRLFSDELIPMLNSLDASFGAFDDVCIYRNLDGDPSELFFEYSLPGYEKEQISVKKHKDSLVVSASRDAPRDREYITKARTQNPRSFMHYIGDGAEIASAKYENGVLCVKVVRPRSEEQSVIVE